MTATFTNPTTRICSSDSGISTSQENRWSWSSRILGKVARNHTITNESAPIFPSIHSGAGTNDNPGIGSYPPKYRVEAIPDNATVDSTIVISGCSSAPSPTSTVDVHIVHTWVGDLVLTLVAPDGSTYLLRSRTGGSADNIDQVFTVNLAGETSNGAWKLRVQDAASLDTGYINSWTLTL